MNSETLVEALSWTVMGDGVANPSMTADVQEISSTGRAQPIGTDALTRTPAESSGNSVEEASHNQLPNQVAMDASLKTAECQKGTGGLPKEGRKLEEFTKNRLHQAAAAASLKPSRGTGKNAESKRGTGGLPKEGSKGEERLKNQILHQAAAAASLKPRRGTGKTAESKRGTDGLPKEGIKEEEPPKNQLHQVAAAASLGPSKGTIKQLSPREGQMGCPNRSVKGRSQSLHQAAVAVSLETSRGTVGTRDAITGRRLIPGDDSPPLIPIGWNCLVTAGRTKSTSGIGNKYLTRIQWIAMLSSSSIGDRN
eukprot:gene7548-697_t